MLCRSQFPRQPLIDWWPCLLVVSGNFATSIFATHTGRPPPSVLAILWVPSSAVEGHPAFEGSWPDLQLLG